MACDKDNDIDTIKIDYPNGIEDLAKKINQKIDFTASTNPNTITYTYNQNSLVTSSHSSRNNTVTTYTYNADNLLATSSKTDINDVVISESSYTYGENGLITLVTIENGIEVENTQWQTSNSKAIEGDLTLLKQTKIVIEKIFYAWQGEDLEKTERFEKIDMETSFNNFEDFPTDVEKTLETIIDFYNLEPLESNNEYYLIKRFEYESYNEGINTPRYLSTLVPVTESQKVFMVNQIVEYDEEKKSYFSSTGYTTLDIDDDGYPSRIVTGGYGAKKLDLIYQ